MVNKCFSTDFLEENYSLFTLTNFIILVSLERLQIHLNFTKIHVKFTLTSNTTKTCRWNFVKFSWVFHYMKICKNQVCKHRITMLFSKDQKYYKSWARETVFVYILDCIFMAFLTQRLIYTINLCFNFVFGSFSEQDHLLNLSFPSLNITYLGWRIVVIVYFTTKSLIRWIVVFHALFTLIFPGKAWNITIYCTLNRVITRWYCTLAISGQTMFWWSNFECILSCKTD